MKKTTMIWAMGLMLIFGSISEAQKQNGKVRDRQSGKQKQGETPSHRGDGIGAENPLAIGDSGVAWYTTWTTGLAEAKRSNRPIFFMSAATTCGGVPGVF